MINKIEIKAFFKWGEATPENAFKFCNEMIKTGMPNVDPDKRIERINKYHLRGITYEELKANYTKNELGD